MAPSQLRAGQVSINGGGGDLMPPFGGYKMSGNDSRWGDFAFHEFLETKAILGYQPKQAAEIAAAPGAHPSSLGEGWPRSGQVGSRVQARSRPACKPHPSEAEFILGPAFAGPGASSTLHPKEEG